MERLDQTVRRRVGGSLDALAENPYGGALRKLTSRPGSRLRVGDWRVLVELDAEARVIHVNRVLPRGRAYDR
jgi:mRNA-degrading endonuclease RelE of RelBE toxin-antitoxin system